MGVYCVNCEHECSERAKACPKCGHPLVGTRRFLVIGCIAIVVTIAGSVAMWVSRKEPPATGPQIPKAEEVARDAQIPEPEASNIEVQPGEWLEEGDEATEVAGNGVEEQQEPAAESVIVPIKRRATLGDLLQDIQKMNRPLWNLSERFWEINSKSTELQRTQIIDEILREGLPPIEALFDVARSWRAVYVTGENLKVLNVLEDGTIVFEFRGAPETMHIFATEKETGKLAEQVHLKDRLDAGFIVAEVVPRVALGPAFAKPKEIRTGPNTIDGYRRPKDIAGFPAKRDPHIVCALVVTAEESDFYDVENMEAAAKYCKR